MKSEAYYAQFIINHLLMNHVNLVIKKFLSKDKINITVTVAIVIKRNPNIVMYIKLRL